MWLLVFLAAAQEAPTLGERALAVAKGNADVAAAAAKETAEDEQESQTSAQLVIAHAAASRAQATFDTSRPYVPNAKQAETTAEIDAKHAEVDAGRAKTAEANMKAVAQEAADAAGQEILAMVKADAQAEAKKAADKAKDWEQHKAERKAAAAAALMEPYHLAQLREQKISAIDHAKAMSAMESAKQLAGKAEQMAADAQSLQNAGLTIQAAEMMQSAHDTMNGASSLQENAKKLYASASEAGGRAGYYVYAEQQAGAAAAAATLYNKPPAFPGLLQVDKPQGPGFLQGRSRVSRRAALA